MERSAIRGRCQKNPGFRFASSGLHETTARTRKTRFRTLAAGFAQDIAVSFGPLQSEGAGNAGRPMRPIAACAMVVVERTRVSQVTPESPGIPRAMVLRLPSSSPRRPALLPPSSAKIAFRELDASTGASGPHDFSVRKRSTLVFGAARGHRILSRVRDDLEPPLCGTGRRQYELICYF
jgi:hypothetical protein